MLYDYQYSITEGIHSYEFSTIPLRLSLTPSNIVAPDLDPSLNILCIDLVRNGSKGNHKVGKTVCHILNNFIEANKDHALGYYPSSTDNKEDARVCLFNKWANCFVPGDDITSYISKFTFPSTNGIKEELALQVYAHKDYPNDSQLIKELNTFSKLLGEK